MRDRLTIFIGILLMIVLVAFQVQAATEEEVEASIAVGIEWLVAQQNSNGSWGGYEYVAHTGFAVIKLEDRAFELGYDSPFDEAYPYHAQVEAGLDYLFSQAGIIYIFPQTAGDPDSDGDSIGVFIADSYHRTYSTGIALMAIAGSRDPGRTVTAGGAVNGWTYGDVVQDAVDYFAFGQNDAGWPQGAWGYTDNQGWSDNSNSGYAVLGLDFVESDLYGFNAFVPQFLKDELNIWIDFIQNDVDGDTYDGGSGYADPNDWVNMLKTGNIIYQMAFYGDAAEVPRVLDAVDYIERHWNDNTSDPGFRPHHYQAIYCMMKGLERMGFETIMVGATEIDWFDELSTIIVTSQNSNGSWPYDYWGDDILSACWALLTLEKVVPPSTMFVNVDIKPRSCPNPFNPKSNGVVPVAVLGTEEFDVTTIDPATVMLDRDFDDDLEGVYAVRWAYEDVATPVIDGEECECTTCGADGYMDLTLKFDTQEVLSTLGDIYDGEVFPVFLHGNLFEEFGSTGIEGSDCFIIRFKGGKMSKPLAETDQIPDVFALYSVAPNPFNPSTTISYGLPEASSVEIIIYNMLGQKVSTLISQNQAAGIHSIRWQPERLPSGVYILSFTAGDFHQIAKLLFVK